jgi:replication-associated recombination protein RarA
MNSRIHGSMHYEETMKIGVNEYKYFHSNIAVYVESRGLPYALKENKSSKRYNFRIEVGNLQKVYFN